MPRNMSFMLTTEQIRNQTKTVTRRDGWEDIKPGEILNACEKCQGLKKGEKIKVICQIRVINSRRERLCDITPSELIKEGFPGMRPLKFIIMFIKSHMGVNPYTVITRIEFEYI